MNKRAAINWIIAIAVAAIYLLISVAFDAWVYSWLIWIAYAMYRCVVK